MTFFDNMPTASTEVRAGCPKLGHTTLVLIRIQLPGRGAEYDRKVEVVWTERLGDTSS